MNKLKLQTPNKANDNFIKLAALFPNAVTETIDPTTGSVVRAIDKDILSQEISTTVVEGREERYQFTWPDKRKAILAANSPISKTLRPCRGESMGRDGTAGGFDSENLYIEGDNLEVLKLLQETYLGKVKMIYIDPPYNTGNDFVYEDDFSMSAEEYSEVSGQHDEYGNRLFKNTESNGRFHTDWLNMMYPRLKLARDLLTDDGVVFISIDDNEVENLKKICGEIFGETNCLACITRATGTPTGGGFDAFVNELDYILVYSKNRDMSSIYGLDFTDEDAKIYNQQDENGYYLTRTLRRTGGEDRREDRPSMFYPMIAPDGTKVYPIAPAGYESRWICGEAKYHELVKDGLVEWKKNTSGEGQSWQVYQKYYLENRKKQPGNLWVGIEGNKKATRDVRTLFESRKVFDFPKPIQILMRIIQISISTEDIILDFFSGSATTAHAVMQLNAEDGGNRKFIMVQLPEETDEKSEAYRAKYKTICEIGKERIRRAGRLIHNAECIKHNEKDKEKQMAIGEDNYELCTMNSKLDIGFRVLKCDSSNMKDVYYRPQDIDVFTLDDMMSNIKEDRTPEDLLFQVMLDLGISLSSEIQCGVWSAECGVQWQTSPDDNSKLNTQHSKLFSVADGYLMACFDNKVTEETITAIAKQKPYYFVMRDSSMENDSVATNFEQIFETYSKETVRKVL